MKKWRSKERKAAYTVGQPKASLKRRRGGVGVRGSRRRSESEATALTGWHGFPSHRSSARSLGEISQLDCQAELWRDRERTKSTDTNRNVGISEGPERKGEEGLREGSRGICFCFRKLLLSGQRNK